MIRLTLAEVKTATGGMLMAADPATAVTGSVEFDSRKVTKGGLFLAFPGERVDGHDYARAAVDAGAVAVVGTRAIPGLPMIVVDDPHVAIGRLARAVLDRLPDLTVIGITGSSGKTTTKDLIAGLLGTLGPTVAPPGSFNNELGLPYTVLRSDANTRYLVLEMGSRGPGHLRYLCQIAPPTIGVVVNVGVSHIGEFGSIDAIAGAKSELVEALPSTGIAVLNVDDDRVRAMVPRTAARVVLVGEAAGATLRASDISLDERGRASYTLIGADGSARVTLGVSGRHQVGNSLLAAGVAAEAGLSVSRIAQALGTLRLASSRRMDVFDRADGITVIDDSYNANPASTMAALRALVALGSGSGGRRTVAVLGYLAELGDYERAGHEEVGRAVARLGVDLVVVIGENAKPIHDGAVSESSWGGTSVRLTDQAAAVALLRDELRPGDVVLVKGSRYRTWEVADALRLDATSGRFGTTMTGDQA
ncbi:MAG: UDP-N-acetylmuramoyl-tripeptide--D-alanyl-D-alanine ligase [Micromonosporaceae bacterium]|nr:UDP-N-acetylmuramoyl-tripeptide--D-alanyl-D-alanine ligase [Micromonosporaceae bacterium]